MLKKLFASVLVSAMFFVPTLGFSHDVPVFSAKAGAESDMALLGAAVKGDTSFEAYVLSSDEMQAIEGARHKKFVRALTAVGEVIIAIKTVVTVICEAGLCVPA